MKQIHVVAVCFALFLAVHLLKAQDTITITFDPPSLPGGGRLLQTYSESGVTFTGLLEKPFGHEDSGYPVFPDNGTAYLQVMRNYCSFSLSSGPLQLNFVDLAEYSVVIASPQTITFTGHIVGGGTVSTNFVTDGIIDGTGPLTDFQTFYFDSRFTDLTSVDMSAGFSMDNLTDVWNNYENKHRKDAG